MDRLLKRALSWVAVATLAMLAVNAGATDRWEPNDNSPFTAPLLIPFGGPQTHDLQASGGVDVDIFKITTRPWRSYEIRVSAVSASDAIAALERRDRFGLVWQTANGYSMLSVDVGQHTFLRWQVAESDYPINYVSVWGRAGATESSQFSIEYLDTTLFCPRYNNTNGQSSVLMIQAAPEGSNSCYYTALFFAQGGTLVGSQSGMLNEADTSTISTSALSGVANTSGSARITHTCGYRNIIAKLVAIEPSTGYSLDSVCSAK